MKKTQWYHFPFHFHPISIPWRWSLVIPVKDASESAFENTALPKNPGIHSIAVGPAVIVLAMMNRGAKNFAEFSGTGRGHVRLPLRSLRPCRDVTDRIFTLPDEIGTERENIFRRALFVTAGQRHVDRFEIESRGLDLVEIVDRAIVGFHR